MIRRVHLCCGPALVALFAFAGCGGGGTTTITPPPPPPPPTEVITITTNPTISLVQNAAFSMTLQETGASSAVTWSVVSGQLPTGLTLDPASGTISGIPVNSLGTATIQAADSKAKTSKTFNFLLYSQLTIDPVTPGPSHINAPYSLALHAEATTAITGWSVSAGQLPPGLTLSVSQFNLSIASIAGTATALGTYTFTVQVQDSSLPQTATLTLTIIVDSHVAITKSQLKNGGQNQAYSDSFAAIDGTPPYHWSISGTLPTGLSLNSATGQVSGTPTDFGGFPYTVTVSDSSVTPQTDSQQAILNLAMQLQLFTNISQAYINTPYNSNFFANGGTYPYTFSVTKGALPPGLTFFPNGIIQGTPTQLGSSVFTVQVTDSGIPAYVVAKDVTMNVTPTPLQMFGNPITVASVNVKYHSQVPLSGGTPPYTWSLNSGTLPPGITLDPANGFLDGTPTQIGTFNYQFKGTDASVPQQSATASGFLQVRTPLGRNDSLATATPLGNSQNQQIPIVFSISPYIDPIDAATPNADTDYFRLVATGSSIVHVGTFAQTAALDTVIELLDQNGVRLQTCVQPGYASPCINDDVDTTTVNSALDFKVPGAPSASSTFYLHVLDWRGDARPDMTYLMNISGVVEPLKISPTDIGPGATRGVAYQAQFSTTGGTGNVSWALDGGTLPPGWSLSTTGLLSGVATTDGPYTYSIKATDSANPPQIARAAFTQQISEPVTITTPSTWPNACVNKSYTFTVKTSGGLPPIRYGFWSDSWPLGGFDDATATFSGTPTVLGTYVLHFGASDSSVPSSGQPQDITLNVVNCP